jgi:hypothetical protein
MIKWLSPLCLLMRHRHYGRCHDSPTSSKAPMSTGTRIRHGQHGSYRRTPCWQITRALARRDTN